MLPAPYYSGHGVDLYQGNCFDVLPFLKDPVDLVLADPPYGTTRNQWDVALDNKQLFHAYRPLLRPRTPVVLFAVGVFTAELIVEGRRVLPYRYSLVWDKLSVTGHLNSKKQPLRAHEDLAVFYDRQPTYNPQMVYTGKASHSRGKRTDRTVNHWGGFDNTPVVEQDGYQYPRSILSFARPKEGYHPNQKPVDLLAWCIRTFTDPGQLVLDNVTGSGSTLVAAAQEGRRAIGIEAREDYCEIAARRLDSLEAL